MIKPVVLKVLTAGEGGVGKTTLLHKYIKGQFLPETRMTIGVEFFLKELSIDGWDIILQLWDFGGQERFRFLLDSYVTGAKGALLMFDLTRTMTLENLDQWVNICRKHNNDLPILFLGTKADLVEHIIIDEKYIMEYKEKFNLFDYMTVSALTGENVEAAFETLTRKIIKTIFY
ncbi:MAG: Rab family GTPase [Promethearchaeota archaeon]